MAKKSTSGNRKAAKFATKKRVKASTPVRKTAVPKKSSAKRAQTRPQITHEQIAQRAYEIYLSGTGGSEFENWVRAEAELRGV